MPEQMLASPRGPICRHQQLARSCEWCEIEHDRAQWQARAEQAEAARDALRAELEAARAILDNAHDVLVVHDVGWPRPWIRTLRDTIAGYLRRGGIAGYLRRGGPR